MVADPGQTVLSQVLMPRCDKPGVVAAFEVMIMSPAIENHIRKSETFKIPSVIQTNRRAGMQLMDESILALLEDNKITAAAAMQNANDPKLFQKFLPHAMAGEAVDKVVPGGTLTVDKAFEILT